MTYWGGELTNSLHVVVPFVAIPHLFGSKFILFLLFFVIFSGIIKIDHSANNYDADRFKSEKFSEHTFPIEINGYFLLCDHRPFCGLPCFTP